jgi:predicted dehydrogenase
MNFGENDRITASSIRRGGALEYTRSADEMTSWTRKLRMGMVGGGQGAFIGAVHRLAGALDGQAELVAGVFSREWNNTRATGGQLYLDPARVYHSYEEMAAAEAKLPADARIDFVSIVTPNHAHFLPARAFLEAGFHVVCDKPLAFTLPEAEELARIVEQRQRVFALTHNYTVEYVTGDRVTAVCADKSIFLPDRTLDEDINALIRLQGGGKGVLTVSQIATGEENGLRLRVYGSKGAILWEQENPNYMGVYRHGRPRETLTRGRSEYLAPAAMAATRLPWGHPEGYFEAFANIYAGAIDAIRRHIDGKPMSPGEYNFPTVHDGVRGMQFIDKAVESANDNASWVTL